MRVFETLWGFQLSLNLWANQQGRNNEKNHLGLGSTLHSNGMSTDEVKAVIGEPDNCAETLGTKTCIWGSEDDTYIKISFLADKALTYSNNGLK